MITIYKLTSDKISGAIELEYTDSLLTRISIAIKSPLNDNQFKGLISSIGQHEANVGDLKALGLEVSAAIPANIKLAAFCRLYEQHKKIKYRVSPADSGKIKLIQVDEPLLEAYFTSGNFLFKNKHSISNLVKYYNELLAEIVAGPASKHPDHYSKAYQDKLSDKECPDYWNHLRSLGYQPKKDKMGNVVDWVKNYSNKK